MESLFIHSQEPELLSTHHLALSPSDSRLQTSICRWQSWVKAGFMDLGRISVALTTNLPGCISFLRQERGRKKKWGLGWRRGAAGSWLRVWGKDPGVLWGQGCKGCVVMSVKWYRRSRRMRKQEKPIWFGYFGDSPSNAAMRSLSARELGSKDSFSRRRYSARLGINHSRVAVPLRVGGGLLKLCGDRRDM